MSILTSVFLLLSQGQFLALERGNSWVFPLAESKFFYFEFWVKSQLLFLNIKKSIDSI